MAVEPSALRRTMRYWATGVTVVTAAHGQVRHGMTVSSFTSVSLAPPLILVCLERETRTCELVLRSGAFAITVLASHQQAISDLFAGRHTEEQDRFAGLDTHTLVTGAPLLADGLAYLDCRLVSSSDFSTHSVIIGEVLAAAVNADKPPLVYFNRAYRRLRE